MLTVRYRQATTCDIPEMARLRSREWETDDYWQARIAKYLKGELHPHKALRPRIAYVALEGDAVIGFIAGHLTRRFGYDGELEWINVAKHRRGSGVASALLRLLATWFLEQKALRICVNVEPDNAAATGFYARHGAQKLNEHWLLWKDIGTILLNG